MAAPSKIQDVAEVIRWYVEEGRTFGWMRDEYRRKYNLDVTPTAFSNLLRRHGIEHRSVMDEDLIPWSVKPEHRNNYNLMMLRVEARLRAGRPPALHDRQRLAKWQRDLRDLNAVVEYLPETAEGFHLVPRQQGDDVLIRRPANVTRKRRRRD